MYKILTLLFTAFAVNILLTLNAREISSVIFFKTSVFKNVNRSYWKQDLREQDIQDSTFTDPRDGQVYKTVRIGSQLWMAQNLNYNMKGSSCYEDNMGNCAIYGRLYNWDAATKARPPGWHLPSQEEWELMIKHLGGKNQAADKMKSTVLWENNKGKITNTSGFSAIPAGYQTPFGFLNIDSKAYWWTSKTVATGHICFAMTNSKNKIVRGPAFSYFKFSVRCVKD